MAKTSLTSEIENAEAVAETISTNDIVATNDELVATSTASAAGISGDIDSEDIKFPLVQIVSGMGKLSDVEGLAKGDLVLDGEYKLTQPASITVIRLAKLYEENLPWGTDEIPRLVNSKAEVLELGGTLGWASGPGGERVAPTWKPMADALICIGCDDEKSTYFPFEHGDKKFAFARWKLRNTAYFSAATDIISAAGTYYRAGLTTGTFELTTEKRAFKTGNTTYVPMLKKGATNTPEFKEWLSEFSA
jgi:hypothetical protein